MSIVSRATKPVYRTTRLLARIVGVVFVLCFLIGVGSDLSNSAAIWGSVGLLLFLTVVFLGWRADRRDSRARAEEEATRVYSVAPAPVWMPAEPSRPVTFPDARPAPVTLTAIASRND